jgi:uncharacterized protein YyaL (SSP411 family)
VLRGTPEAMQSCQALAGRDYRPHRLVFAIPDGAKNLPGVLAERKAVNGIIAYVCAGHACQAPITNLADFESSLS